MELVWDYNLSVETAMQDGRYFRRMSQAGIVSYGLHGNLLFTAAPIIGFSFRRKERDIILAPSLPLISSEFCFHKDQ